ncbi:hypothetical protein DFQ01_13555 [Paenibacillus cellulosilyticus]|uniref:Uncharacterized protein n=1 Tax=Paenibacillus cellulosilyticus TaxID=375489 RepID=A0A2V2YR16_9BACL|nr:hypothetical protein [Paenibacillus cellulosilyticus]PWV92494.1 hypothetical protein DFQ01_13555 [Paenibacillus cellulosilyticus]QKS47064.1 hypothetical protein HUB94_21630 [Paenibacillus cellulosilyticus]
MITIPANAKARRNLRTRRIAILLTLIMLITIIVPLQSAESVVEAAASSDPIISLLNTTKAYIDKAKKLNLAGDQEGAYVNVAKGEAKLLEALRSKGATDPKYGAKFATSGYMTNTVLHPTNTGVEYVRTFMSDIPCVEAGCQGVPISAIMMFKFTDGSTTIIRSHIVPLPGDSGEVEPFFLHVLSQYGLFRTTSGDIIMLSALGNWRGGGWSLTLRNLSHGGRAEPYTTLFNKSDLPEALLKQWNNEQRAFLGLCEAAINCTKEESNQTALKAIDEDAGTVTFGSKLVHLRNVVKVKSSTDRVKLRAFVSGIVDEGTFPSIGIRPGEQTAAATQLGEPTSKRNNMLYYLDVTLQTDAIGMVKHIYYLPRTAGLQSVTLAWLEKQLGTAAVWKDGSYSVSVIIRSRYNLSRLSFTAPSRSSRVQTIALSGALADEIQGYELSAISAP